MHQLCQIDFVGIDRGSHPFHSHFDLLLGLQLVPTLQGKLLAESRRTFDPSTGSLQMSGKASHYRLAPGVAWQLLI